MILNHRVPSHISFLLCNDPTTHVFVAEPTNEKKMIYFNGKTENK